MQKQRRRQGDPKEALDSNEKEASVTLPIIDDLITQAESALNTQTQGGFVCNVCHNLDPDCPNREHWWK